MTMNPGDLQRLADQIRDWNACRLELFEISQPNANGEFYGVIRFFFQEAGEKVATKCIRISNSMSTREIIPILVEKFRPDMRMLTTGSYALYEVHFSEERRLADDEVPLLVQLSWSKGDREGRFLLKNENDVARQNPPQPEMKRRLSKREKKEAKKQAQQATGPVDGKENKPRVGETLYKEVPETSFTRTVSNPEAVMRRRRQQKLEKLQQVQRQEGGARGNIIKIFGEMIDPSIPYKTVLLSRQDTALNVVREMLIKYGKEKEDAANYCLLLVQLQPTSESGQELQRVECILKDDESPLSVAQQLQPEYIRFEICPRNRLPPGPNNPHQPIHNHQQHPQSLLQTLPQAHQQPLKRSLSAEMLARQNSPRGIGLPFLKEMTADGRDLPNSGQVFLLEGEVTDVGRMPRSNNHNIQLNTVGIQPLHCVLARMDGIVTLTPFNNEADTYVDNRRIHETTILEHGAVIRFGRQALFRFFDPNVDQQKRPPAGAIRVLPFANSQHEGPTSPMLMPGLNQPQVQQSKATLLNQFQPAGNESVDELPASIMLNDQAEDAFLNYVVMDSQSVNSQFRLSPAFCIYMATRYRLTTRYQPQPPVHWQDKPQKISVFLEKVAINMRRAIQAKPADVAYLAFWLANSSELLNFLRSDLDLVPLSESSRSIMGEAVQMSFHYLIDAVHLELHKAVIPSFFADNDEDLRQDMDPGNRNSSSSLLSSGVNDVVQLLTVVMSLSRRCKINAGLTIQLFSHWFHFINHRIFNTLVQSAPRYCTRMWGSRILRRLNAVHGWAEKNGLELAVDTHLESSRQAAVLIEAAKDQPAQAGLLATRIFRLNSIQVKAFLDGCARAVAHGLDSAHLSRQLAETLLAAARQTADEALQAAGFDVVLHEREDMNARFLMPDDGYASDNIKDIPPGLQDFLQPLIRDGVCGFNIQSGRNWTVYFFKKSGFLEQRPPSTQMSAFPNNRPPSQNGYPNNQLQQQQQQMNGFPSNRLSQHFDQHPPHSPGYTNPQEPPLMTVQLQKLNNSLGLSIVAARGEVNKQKGIYVKSVVPNGAAYVDGRIKEGDQLVEVDSRSLQGLSQESAAEMLMSTGHIVTLLVARHAAMYHGVATLLGQANLQNQPLPYKNTSPDQNQQQQQPQPQSYSRSEYARPRSYHEAEARTPQQQMANVMTSSLTSAPVSQPAILRKPTQPQPVPTSEQFVAPSYENWYGNENQGDSQYSQQNGSQRNSYQPIDSQTTALGRGSASVPNLLQPPEAPFREILSVSSVRRVVDSSSEIPKVDIDPTKLQPSFYHNTKPLQDQRPYFDRMFDIDSGFHSGGAYMVPNPERRMFVPLPQIPLVEVKTPRETQPGFYKPLQAHQQQQQQQQQTARPQTSNLLMTSTASPSRFVPMGTPTSPVADSNYMHLSELASSSKNRLSNSSTSSVPNLIQLPGVRQTTMSSSVTMSSTFSTTIGSRTISQEPPTKPDLKPMFNPTPSSQQTSTRPQDLSEAKRREEIAELESRAILSQGELERLRQLRIGNGYGQTSGSPSTTQNGSSTSKPLLNGENFENRRSSLQTSYSRDPESERKREEEIEQMRVEKEMERLNIRKQRMTNQPSPTPTTTSTAKLVSTTTPASTGPSAHLAGGLLTGTYTLASPGTSPKLSHKPPVIQIGSKPAPPPVAPKPVVGPRPYKPAVAPKPVSNMPQPWINRPAASSPSPTPPPLPTSPPPSDLPDDFERRHFSPQSGVVGKGEVYRDPRDRILQERAYGDQQQNDQYLSAYSGQQAPGSASRLTFHDKMRLFAHEAGEVTPQNRAKASKTLLQLEQKLQIQ